ncbi:hypothetical protein [Tahibacter caeni]|uniref:hypothetical protein n=1 Tax=Tahibacter caeni TaxID=1453545 RepID=UPI002147E4F3|nr:hypothetical protein [Tahibacter caeni]
MSNPEWQEGPARHYAYFRVSDGYRGTLEKEPFYNRARCAFEQVRREWYQPPLWQYNFGNLEGPNEGADRDGIPQNDNETDFFQSPRFFASIVDRERLDEYVELLSARCAEQCVDVELVDLAQVTIATGQWERVNR